MPAIDPQTGNLPTIKTCKSPFHGFDGPLPVRFGPPLISVDGCQLVSESAKGYESQINEGIRCQRSWKGRGAPVMISPLVYCPRQ